MIKVPAAQRHSGIRTSAAHLLDPLDPPGTVFKHRRGQALVTTGRGLDMKANDRFSSSSSFCAQPCGDTEVDADHPVQRDCSRCGHVLVLVVSGHIHNNVNRCNALQETLSEVTVVSDDAQHVLDLQSLIGRECVLF